MCSGRPNTPGERKDRLQGGGGECRAAAANAVNPSAAGKSETRCMLRYGTAEVVRWTVCAPLHKQGVRKETKREDMSGFLTALLHLITSASCYCSRSHHNTVWNV